MLQKFKKIKDRAFFYMVLSKKTGIEPHSIQNNWFKRLFCGVPVPHVATADKTLDDFIQYESELQHLKEKLHIKYFGK